MAQNTKGDGKNLFRGPARQTASEHVDMMDVVRAMSLTMMGNIFTDDGSEAWGLPYYFIGPPGGGKTSRFRIEARKWYSKTDPETQKYGLPFECMKPGARGEGGFGVTPVVATVRVGGKDVKVIDFPPPRAIIEKFANGKGFLLVDEVPTAPPAIQPAMLGLIQEKELGAYKFPPGVRIFGAGNAIEETAGGWDIPAPVANRMGHMAWSDPEIAETQAFLMNGGYVDTSEKRCIEDAELETMRAWLQVYPSVAGAVAGFLQRRPDLLRRQPLPGNPAAGGAWSSPRTWEMAGRALTSSKICKLSETATDMVIEGLVGNASANEFATWRRQADLPDPIAVLDGKINFKHDRTRLDRTAAVLTSCVATLLQPNLDNKPKRAGRFWKVVGKVIDDAADLAMNTVTQTYKTPIVNVPEAAPVLAAMQMVTSAAKR